MIINSVLNVLVLIIYFRCVVIGNKIKKEPYSCLVINFILNDDIYHKIIAEIEHHYLSFKLVKMETNKLLPFKAMQLIFNNSKCQFVRNESHVNKPRNIRIKVAAINFPPHMTYTENNGKCTIAGFCGHFYRIFQSNFNMSIHVIKNKEDQFGFLKNGSKWFGMIGDVVNGVVDIASCVAITRERKNVVDYSPSMYSARPKILYRQLSQHEISYSFFFKPFYKTIWLSIFGISLIIILIEIFSNFRFKQNLIFSYTYKILNGFLYCWPIVLLRKIPIFSKFSVKLSMIIYLTFSMLMYSIYSSLLTALFATSKLRIPFKSLEEMVTKTDFLPVVITGTSSHTLLKKLYKNQAYIEVKSVKEGVDTLFFKKGGLLVTPNAAAKFINKNCSFAFAFEHVCTEKLSLAYSKQFPYMEFFNIKILQFKQSGLLALLNNRYMLVTHNCIHDNLFHSISYAQVIGPIVFLLGGILVSLIFWISEILLVKFKKYKL